MKAPKTIVQLIHLDETGDSYYRMRWPAIELSELEPSWRVINLDATCAERFSFGLEADLLVVFPIPDLELVPLIRARKAAGKKTLIELNDNFYEPQRWSPIVEGWSSPLVWYAYEQLVEAADGVIVTGESLKQIFSTKFPAAIFHVLQNNLHEPIETLDKLLQAKPTSEVALGWGGSLGHIADFIWSIPILHRLLDKIPELRLHLMGNVSITGLVRVPPERLNYVAWGSLQDYYAFWKPVHVGYAPALNTPYNCGRSDIKALEMIAHAAMPVLPNIAPYQELAKQLNLKTWSNAEELEKLLFLYLKDPDLRNRDLQGCYEYVVSQRQAKIRSERRDLFASLLSNCSTSENHDPALLNLEAGYHYIKGTPEGPSRSTKIMTEVRALLKSGQRDQAQVVIEAACKQNPWNPDIALLHLSVLATNADSSLSSHIGNYVRNFPKDARFTIFCARLTASSEDRNIIWGKFITDLKSAPEQVRKFAIAHALETFCAHVRDLKIDGSVMRKFLELSPKSAQLRFALAEAFEKLGHYKDSSDCYSWLEEELGEFALNQKFLGNIDIRYIAGWSAAMKARIS